MAYETLATLTSHAIGGGWGQDKPDQNHTFGVAVIRGTDIPKIAAGDLSTVPRRWETPKKAERRLLRAGDLIVEVSGGSPTSGQHTGRTLHLTTLALKQLGGLAIPASFCRLLRLDSSRVDPRFVAYQIANLHLTNEIAQFENQSTGLANFQFQKFIESVSPEISDLHDQKRIANVLSSLDNRIRHNRALAANLEAIARTLFKSWFVDFDPVRAKAAGEVPPGLAPDLAALFPDRFVDSELGEIPEGWNAATLSGVCSLNPEAWTSRKHPEKVEYVDLANVKAGEIENRASYSWDESPSRARRVLRPGDTIVGTVRPGNRSCALIAEDGLTGSTGFAALRPNSEWLREFVYLAATSDDAIDRLTHLADGAAYPAVRPDVVIATEAVIPSEDVAKEFSAILRPLIDRVAASRSESAALTQLRDLLLPRLISGKLRVEDAEAALEAD